MEHMEHGSCMKARFRQATGTSWTQIIYYSNYLTLSKCLGGTKRVARSTISGHSTQQIFLLANAKANKIVAGLEPEKTNAWLQRLHAAATTCAGEKSDAAVARVQSGELVGAAKEKKKKPKEDAPAAPPPAPPAEGDGEDEAKKEEEKRKRAERKKREEEKKRKEAEEAARAEAEPPAPPGPSAADEEEERRKEEKRQKDEERRRRKEEEKRQQDPWLCYRGV